MLQDFTQETENWNLGALETCLLEMWFLRYTVKAIQRGREDKGGNSLIL